VVLGDVSSTYTDIVETVFSSLHGVRLTRGRSSRSWRRGAA
jgi:hypothetical protein